MRYFLFLAALFILPSHAFALSSDWIHTDDASVRLISQSDAVGDTDAVSLGLEVELANGWHTYWRSPGEAGLPPQLDWTHSQTTEGNLKSATLLYPAPRRYTAYGLETVGYREHVVFPINAILRTKGQALNAALSVDLLVCSSICVPKHFDLALLIPVGPLNESNEAPLIHQARDQLPTDPETAGLLVKSISNDGDIVTITVTAHDALVAPDVFVEDDANIGFGAPVVKMDPEAHSATLSIKPVDNLPAGTTLANMPVTITLIDGDHATEIKTKISPTLIVVPEPKAPALSLYVALLFALIGGFILNLMPCVLPVLSLKILSIASHGGGDARKVRHSFLVTAAGIIFSFLILAGTTITLKHFGLALGWGVQFQQPAFLMLLVLLLTFFAANLWDVFEINLPRFLADRFDRPYNPKLAGDFATGAFATILATPCSAPFLGTAVGFALASDAPQILAIFLALGIGMALPYMGIALFPSVATLLPKPGAWMLRLRHILGFALAITALWLVWVLAAQITVLYAIVFGLFMTAIVALMAARKQGIKTKLIKIGVAELCVLALLLGFTGALKPRALPEVDRRWLPFDQNALNADIAEGKTVFLDITADWCLTCKANMKFTLSDEAVVERLFQGDVIAMQGDWTNPDPVITDLLHKYGRYGIPFNAVYGPAAPQGIILPELLTPKVILKALDKASSPPP